jgi:cytidylate kinase
VKRKFIVTIARQYGSGGLMIAKQLSNVLSIPFYDKTLLQIAAKKSGLEENFFEKSDEDKNFLTSGMFANVFDTNSIFDDLLFKIQSDVIRQIAQKESAIFVGRCADYILREHPNCISIFIYADKKDKIKRISLKNNISQKEAETLIGHKDKERFKYYNYYTQKIWSSAESYNLCVNFSILGIDETVFLIRYFIEKKFK